MFFQVQQCGVEAGAADIFEHHVEAFRRCGDEFGKQRVRILAAVVDGMVEAQFRRQAPAFIGAAGDADDARPRKPCQLPGDRTHGTGCGTDQQCLAGDRPQYAVDADMGGQAGTARNRDVMAHRCDAARIDRPVAVASPADRIILDGVNALDPVAELDARRLAGHHPADGTRAHGVADCDGWQVAGAVVEPAAHRRVNRRVMVADQEFAFADLGNSVTSYGKIAFAGDAARARYQDKAAVALHHCAAGRSMAASTSR